MALKFVLIGKRNEEVSLCTSFLSGKNASQYL